MSVSKLPSGRWRAQVWSRADGRNVSAAVVLGHPEGSYRTKSDAKAAREQARRVLAARKGNVTVREWRARWLEDPLFARPKLSTMIHNRERTHAFTERYGHLTLDQITDQTVAEWIAGGRNLSTVAVLKAMWNDAMSAKAGRVTTVNPWQGVSVPKRGRGKDAVPSEEMVWDAVRAARRLTSPYFGAWLQVACFTGLRPGELDALKWSDVDMERGRIVVREQFNAKTRTFTRPKNGLVREAPLTGPARDALMGLPRVGEFCFVNLQGKHFTPSARAYHWKAVRAAIGFDGPLYLLTRHWAGWYMRNVLGLDAEDVAVALGHTDGGVLVRSTYGHLEADRVLDRVVGAYERVGNVRPLRAVREESA